MSRIVFINPNLRHAGGLLTVYPPLGILSIASFLRNNHHDVAFIDADIDNQSFQHIENFVRQYQPDFIGITMTTLQCKSVFTLAGFIKKQFPSSTIIVGGVHPSALKSEILKQCPDIDLVVVGEGEHTFLDLVNTIDKQGSLDEVHGICFRNNETIHTTQPREFIENLDSLPFPAFDLVAPLSKYPGPYPVGARPSIHIMASRGCPFGCQFCSNPIWGNKVRFHSPEYILKEIEWLQETFHVHEIFFQDDTFNLNRQWLEKICSGIISGGLNKKCVFKAPFRANANLVSQDLLQLLKNAGFWMIFYGVESGDPTVLRSIHKNLTLDEIKRAFYLTKKAGIRTYASFMVGNLNDTPSSIKTSLEFAKKIDPDYFGFAVTMPYPGSRLFEILEKQNQISLEDTMNFKMGKYIIPNMSFLEGEVENSCQRAMDEIKRFQNTWSRKFVHYIRYHYFPPAPDEYCDYLPFEPSHLPDPFHSYVEIGITDDHYLGKGWNCCEYWPPPVRWTKESAVLYLHPKEADTVLKIQIMATRPRGDQILTISIDRETHSIPVEQINQGIITIPIHHEIYLKKFIRIIITAKPTWIPNIEIQNGDLRTLGVAITKIWTE
jgi:anaerobic magnesium-protoporphyrin IX monomethyl ester cyclase